MLAGNETILLLERSSVCSVEMWQTSSGTSTKRLWSRRNSSNEGHIFVGFEPELTPWARMKELVNDDEGDEEGEGTGPNDNANGDVIEGDEDEDEDEDEDGVS